MKKSLEHGGATYDNDYNVWLCSECGAESADFALFEESGQYEDCMANSVADEPELPDINDVVAWAEIERARQHIEDTKKSFAKITVAVQGVIEDFDDFSKSMRMYKTKLLEDKTIGEKETRRYVTWTQTE